MNGRGNQILHRLDWYAGIPLVMATSLWRKTFYASPQPPDNPQNIGIICMGAIGDLLYCSALANGLRKLFPQAKIEFIVSQDNAAALPLIVDRDSAIALPISQPHKIILNMRLKSYDLLFDTNQWARFGALACNLSGAKFTTGFSTAGQYRDFGYNLRVPHRADRHERDNFLSLGKSIWPQMDGQINISVPHQAKRTGLKEQKIVYCHMWPAPGTGRLLKQWPENYWHELGCHLLDNGFELGFTGSAKDRDDTLNFIQRHFAGDARVHCLAGACNLVELAARFETAAAVISVNTGTMHLASLLGAPTVGLHGPTNPLRWGPLGPRAKSLLPRKGHNAYLDLGFEYPAGAKANMVYLPVSDVLNELEKLEVL